MSKDYCESLVGKLTDVKDLPEACRQYPSVVEKLEAKAKPVDPFEGMWSGAALAARSSRAQGKETGTYMNGEAKPWDCCMHDT
jgi:hypothetical protein